MYACFFLFFLRSFLFGHARCALVPKNLYTRTSSGLRNSGSMYGSGFMELFRVLSFFFGGDSRSVAQGGCTFHHSPPPSDATRAKKLPRISLHPSHHLFPNAEMKFPPLLSLSSPASVGRTRTVKSASAHTGPPFSSFSSIKTSAAARALFAICTHVTSSRKRIQR